VRSHSAIETVTTASLNKEGVLSDMCTWCILFFTEERDCEW
jgi:hypothetical protein